MGAVAILFLVGVVWLLYTQKTPGTNDITIVPQDTKTTASDVGTPTSASTKTAPKSSSAISYVLKQPGSHECKYEQISPTSHSNGTIYIASGKIREEFRSTVVDKTVSIIMVYDGTNLYSWQEGMSVGKKSKFTSLAQLPLAIPNNLSTVSVVGSGLDSTSWDCHAWIKDSSLLKAPSYVKF